MAQVLQVRNKGLYTAPNEFSSVPPGALVLATNCVITAENIIEPRRGFDRVATLTDAAYRHQYFEFYQDVLMSTFGTIGSTFVVGYKNVATFTALSGTFNHPSTTLARSRFLLTQNNLYFTTSTGVYRLDAYTGTPTLSGAFKGLDVSLALSGVTGFLDGAQQVAYRIVWGIRDANNTVHLGAPSGRAVIINTNAAGNFRNVAVTSTIPTGVTTSYFYQVYRSKQSGGLAVEPDDELGLVYENNPTAGEITAGTFTFTDQTPDSLRGATIYTAASQETILQANDRPPVAWDIEEFQNCTVYANTTGKQRKVFTLLATGGTNGLAANDTITIAGTVYTAKAAETIASGEFKVFTAGTPSQNIFDTACSLVRVVNRYTTNTTVYAYYVSAYGDLPGQILIEERGVGGATFPIIATTAASPPPFDPVLPTSGTSVSSSNDAFLNALMFSKSGIGEAVPTANVLRVGSANNRILRIKKLKSSLFVFKEREGIYRMTGTAPSNFQVDIFDSSAKLYAPNTVEVVNNQIWCLCDQGVTVVSETGVSVVSRPIEDLILAQFGGALNAVKYYSFGVGYETERQYHLHTVTSSADTVPHQVFVFNIFTQAFTAWDKSNSCGRVSPVDDLMYLGSGSTYDLEQERKNRDYTDYVDYGLSRTITSQSSTLVYLNTTADLEVGDVLYQSASIQSLITDVQPAYVEVEDTITFALGAATVYKSFECELEWAAVTGQNPGMVHQFPEVTLLAKAARFNNAEISFATDCSGYFEGVTISGNRTGLWGLFPWGEAAWGSTATTVPLRCDVPLEKQRGSLIRVRFTHQQGYGYFKLNGFSMPVRDTGSIKVTM